MENKNNSETKVLELLTEDEIQLVCYNADVDIFLNVFRWERDKNKYKKYIKIIGRLDKRNSIAQHMCPRYSYDLYKKGDRSFATAIEKAIESLDEKFCKITDFDNKEITSNEISIYTDDELAKLYIYVLEKWEGFSTELFFLVLKIKGINIEDFRNENINIKIETLLKQIAEEEKLGEKIDDEKKKLEKELTQHFNAEKEKLVRNNRTLSQSNEQLKKQIEDAECELAQLRNRDEKEKESYFSEIKKQIDKELRSYKNEQEERLNEEFNIKKQSMIQAIKDEKSQKEQEIADMFDDSLKSKEKELCELVKKIEGLKASLQEETSEQERLKHENESLVAEQERLVEFEREYLRNVKERILQVELDRSLYKFVNSNTESGEIDGAINGGKLPIVGTLSFFENETEQSQEILELEDFIQDLSDNIALIFDNSNEIATIVTSAFLNKKIVIIDDSIASYIAGSFSALIDAKPTGVIDINGSAMDNAIKAINGYDGKVIVVNGVLSAYDELLFNLICQECSDKYIFMTISDVNDIKMFSKSVLQKAFILDIEQDYSFISNDPLWVGKHNIEQFYKFETKEDLRKRYDKHFRNMVSEHVFSKVSAVELSKVLDSYLLIMSEIGEVISRSIRFYTDDTNIDNDEMKKLLEKNGWKSV